MPGCMNWGYMKIALAYHEQKPTNRRFNEGALPTRRCLTKMAVSLAWEEERGGKITKNPNISSFYTGTCRNTAHTVRIGAFFSFPCNFSLSPYIHTVSRSFHGLHPFISFLVLISCLACFRLPPPHCCFKTLLINVNALWGFLAHIFTHLGPFPPHAFPCSCRMSYIHKCKLTSQSTQNIIWFKDGHVKCAQW